VLAFSAAQHNPGFAIEGGTATSDPNGLRRHVVRIIGHDGETCSGTIIGPRKIVTAAHCFESTDPRNYRVVTLDPHFAPREMPVAAIVTHPHFDRTAIDGSRVINDIALVYTTRPFPADMAPAAIVSGASLGPFSMTAAGFGTSVSTGPGALREVQVTSQSPASGSNGNLLLTSGPCSGDSGGPIFRKSGNTYGLVGIISWADTDCASVTAATPTARYRAFVNSFRRRRA